MISPTAVIYPNVRLGRGCIVEDYAVIGAPPSGYKPGELETVIGDNARIRSHTVIYAGNRIGRNFQTGNKANLRECNIIGAEVSIGTLSVVEHHVRIGDNVRIHTQAFVPEFSVLEENCWIGPNVVLTNARYPRSRNAKKELEGVCVRKDAVIGANSTLLPGVTVGVHALVGAASVVTHDVPDGAVVAGNPAVILRYLDASAY